MSGLLATLGWRFLVMAFLAIGGANAVVPEMHRQVVEVERWMSAGEFAGLFAIASAAPGPNVLVVTLVGWQVAGFAGAAVATLAMIGPTSILAYLAFQAWSRVRDVPWARPVQDGLAAVTVGLVASSGFLLARAADTGPATAVLTVGTATVAIWTRLNPLWAFAAAAATGAAGLT